MSNDKAIEHGKEKRKPYKRAQAVDSTCRNHGSCPYCESNRRHADRKRRSAAERDQKEFQKDGDN